MKHILGVKRFQRFLQPKRIAIFEACLIGLVSALVAAVLKNGVGWLGGWRITASHLLPAWLVLPAIGLVGGLLAGLLVERVAPETSGSGMSEVKAVLARVPIPLDLRVAVVKMASSILVLGSGMALGREGPTVQIGAALAAQLSRWIPTSADYRRQLIAAGAGAGLAAAFNAPIAGVMFVVEELLQDMSDLTLGTAILASFIAAVFSRVWGGHSLDLDLHLTATRTSFFAEEIPFYVILGVLSGVLGGLFNEGVLFSLELNKRLHYGLAWRVALAGLISGLAVALLPLSFHDNAGVRELLIGGQADWKIAALAFFSQFVLILVASGSGAPGGLLVPTLILGAALGYSVGVCEYSWLGMSLPTTYARVGMGAFFSGVARVPITGIIIIFEMTTDFNLVLPLMIGSIIAYLVGEKVSSGSIYDRLLEWKGIHLEKEQTAANGPLARLTATEVMQRRVETLDSKMTLDEATQAFSRSHHRGFPVVDEGKLVGIITQTDLIDITQRQLSGDTAISEIMTPQPVTVNPTDTLIRVLYLLNHYSISRLPVTTNGCLVGIITRSDIIRAESDRLNGDGQLGPQAEPSYVVYQNRVPAMATGQGRLLVPLANPQTTPSLIHLAMAIARQRHYELECLQVVLVPRNIALTEAGVDISASHELLEQAVSLGQHWQIPIHTQIRLTHDVAQAILETIKQQHVDLTLMGWKGSTDTPGRVFGGTVDTVIRQAASEVVLVKLSQESIAQVSDLHHGEKNDDCSPNPKPSLALTPRIWKRNANAQPKIQIPLTLDRWLVPMAGGPNAQEAIRLLPALVSTSEKLSVRLCQVFTSTETNHDTTVLEQAAHFLQRHLNTHVNTTAVCAGSVPEAVIALAESDNCDAIILGASRERLLRQALQGNIPELIARKSHCTVILVRGA